MEEYKVVGKTLPETYHEALKTLYVLGDYTKCPDWNCTQQECSMTMVVREPLKEPMISKLFIGGMKELEQYRQEMLDGILDFEIEKGKWEYTYHDRMTNYPCVTKDGETKHINQIQFVIDELKRNPYSRRAVIIIRNVGIDAGNADPACLQHIQYFIRGNELDCDVLFRSNDACKATFMNAFALIKLQEKIASELGVDVGTYTHRANSFHCYEKDYELLESYFNRIVNTNNDDELCYSYEDDWKEIMESYKLQIAKEVEALKSR